MKSKKKNRTLFQKRTLVKTDDFTEANLVIGTLFKTFILLKQTL